jgi:hypothetical protein
MSRTCKTPGIPSETKHANHGCRRRIDSYKNIKIHTENISELEKEKVIQVQESFRIPNRQNQKRNTTRCIYMLMI